VVTSQVTPYQPPVQGSVLGTQALPPCRFQPTLWVEAARSSRADFCRGSMAACAGANDAAKAAVATRMACPGGEGLPTTSHTEAPLESNAHGFPWGVVGWPRGEGKQTREK
jgi:hypothetical protein